MFTHAKRPYQDCHITSGKTHPRFQGIQGFLDQLLHNFPESGDKKITQQAYNNTHLLNCFKGSNIFIFLMMHKLLKDHNIYITIQNCHPERQ